jgi:protein TonB
MSMQPVSISISRSNEALDVEPAATAVLMEKHFVFPLASTRPRGNRFGDGLKWAVTASILVHLALGLVFSVCDITASVRGSPEILQVTWVNSEDRWSLPQKKHPGAALPHRLQAQAQEKKLSGAQSQMPVEARREDRSRIAPTDGSSAAVDQKDQVGATDVPAPAVHEAVSAAPKREAVATAASLSVSEADVRSSDSPIVKPRYRENAPPVYPSAARRNGQEGMVVIRAEILPEGRPGVLKIKASSGYPVLDQSALETVRTWRFEPARQLGKPISAWVDIPIRFVLNQKN